MDLHNAPEPQDSGGRRARARTGRNLPIAVGVGVGLGALLVASLYTVKVAFVAVTVVAIGVAIWEFQRAVAVQAVRVPLVPLILGSIAMLVSAYLRGVDALVVALCITSLAMAVWRLPEGPDSYVRDVTASVFTAVHVPFLAGFAMLLAAPPDGQHRVLIFIAVTVCSDIGGYFTGILIGRHRLAPVVSPKKTWEGLAGSAIACMACGAVLVNLLLGGQLWEGVVLGAAVVCAATLGDLGESMIKRDLGIKDMGTLLPEHGGIMDRLDSLLLSAPVTWLVLTLLLPS